MSDSVVITHPEKVMFPGDDITKGELASYYGLVAPMMVRHIRGRPVTMERFHRGIAAPGFFQKNVAKAPDFIERVAVPKKEGVVNYPIVEDERGILWLANQNCITPHVWTSRSPRLMYPDLCLFDLDPLDEDFDRLRNAALLVREVLHDLGCVSWIKTSGSRGFHIAFPLDGRSDYGQVARFAHAVGRVLVERDPDNFTQEFYKADRGGRILIDTGRNEYGATYAAPYAVRARPHAPVSAPCTWEELEDGSARPDAFTLRAMEARLATAGDLWGTIHAAPNALPSL
ncbi:MAG TPA: non-homologous end-joining DNA ligase [Gemmatimonadaceae bacterium]|nr:non-homologous end-joining DNA ligase [Gemmatimonadaceae bacterium]